MKNTQDIINKAKNIKLVVFDVDGVLTTGQLHYGPNGEEHKVFHVQDGLGIQLLLQAGIEVAIISGRNSAAVTKRFTDLGVKHIIQGQNEKLESFLSLLVTLNLHAEQAVCVGDDLPDMPLIQQAGLGIAVANAVPAVIKIADCCTELTGGMGAAREICEFILQAQDKLSNLENSFY